MMKERRSLLLETKTVDFRMSDWLEGRGPWAGSPVRDPNGFAQRACNWAATPPLPPF